MVANRKQVCDALGRKIIAEIRDEACQYLQWVISGEMADATSQAMFEEYQSLEAGSAIVLQHFLTVAVDACLAQFLSYLDENCVPLFLTVDGAYVDARESSDGLVGELYNESGWISRFSRFKDRIEPAPPKDGPDSGPGVS